MGELSVKISDKFIGIVLSPLDSSCYGMQQAESFNQVQGRVPCDQSQLLGHNRLIFFLRPHSQHREGPGQGTESEPQLQHELQLGQRWIL